MKHTTTAERVARDLAVELAALPMAEQAVAALLLRLERPACVIHIARKLASIPRDVRLEIAAVLLTPQRDFL